MNTSHLNVDEISRKYARRQSLWRISFAVVLVLTLGAVVALLLSLYRQSTKAQQVAKTQEVRADAANKDVGQVAGDLFDKIKMADAQAASITAPDIPILSVWKPGVLEQNPNRPGYVPVDPQLIPILNTRRFLMGSVSKSMFESSPALKSYACGHKWFVIGGTFNVDDPDRWLKTRKDPRYALTAWVTGPVHPTQRGLVVGWFLTAADADKLIREIDSVNHNGPFKRQWDFGFDPKTCDVTAE
jgi:hypothetical protein